MYLFRHLLSLALFTLSAVALPILNSALTPSDIGSSPESGLENWCDGSSSRRSLCLRAIAMEGGVRPSRVKANGELYLADKKAERATSVDMLAVIRSHGGAGSRRRHDGNERGVFEGRKKKI
ncbi:hypothetical protein BDR22DRAFT_823269 [Usnea florida]